MKLLLAVAIATKHAVRGEVYLYIDFSNSFLFVLHLETHNGLRNFFE